MFIGEMTAMTVEPQFTDKFIAFIDVLGFKDMIECAERGEGRSIGEIKSLLMALEQRASQSFFTTHGPKICPSSNYIEQSLDFQICQVSDCAIISAEISPAGVANIIHHCWGVALNLLTKGVLVRGYITRGSIYHRDCQFMGTGYQTAYRKEAGVTAFKKEADEKGTPFVEIDPSVASYVAAQTDSCVRKMFNRFVKQDGDLTALFPFQSLSHSFAIGGLSAPDFDAQKEKKNNDIVRKNLTNFKEEMLKYVDPTNERALKKVRHYIAALDEQLAICDKTDSFIDALCRPIGRPLSDLFRPASN